MGAKVGVVIGIALLGGCGRIGFDPTASGAGLDSGERDGADDAAVFPTGPFGPPQLVPNLSTGVNEEVPSVTGDGLELYLEVNSLDLYVSRRTAVTDAWPLPSPVSELNTGGVEGSPGVAADGLTMWFTADRGSGYDLYVTTRPDRAAPWGAPSPVTELNSAAGEVNPWPSPDELTLLFRRGTDLFMATRSSPAAPWGTPRALDELNTPVEEGAGRRIGRLEIIFSRGTNLAPPFIDLYRARRASEADPFTDIQPITELNTAEFEFDGWPSLDGHTLWLASDRGGSPNYNIYEAVR